VIGSIWLGAGIAIAGIWLGTGLACTGKHGEVPGWIAVMAAVGTIAVSIAAATSTGMK